MESVEAFLSLGSNLGDREGFLKRAIGFVSRLPGTMVEKVSGIYETEPVEVVDQPLFLNVAACILTSSKPVDLLRSLKEIEKTTGRVPRERWHEREIDIDIIFYGEEAMDTGELTVPHPKAHLRRFVLEPLNEIAPAYLHPVFHKTVGQLLKECADISAVNRLSDRILWKN